jgi:hypothetical protein
MWFYNPNHGPFKAIPSATTFDYGVTTLDSGLVLDEYRRWEKVYADYDLKKANFDKKRFEYNIAIYNETLRLSNPFKAYMAPKTHIPQRPCLITLPDAVS